MECGNKLEFDTKALQYIFKLFQDTDHTMGHQEQS